MAEIEVFSRIERRRKWSASEKAALLAEIEAEGGRVSVVARRHRIAESVLYSWRSALRAAGELSLPEAVNFMPLGIVDQRTRDDSPVTDHVLSTAPPPSARVGIIEIELPTGTRLRVDASVDDKALSRVFRALKVLA